MRVGIHLRLSLHVNRNTWTGRFSESNTLCLRWTQYLTYMPSFSSFLRRVSGSQQQPLLPTHQQQAPLAGDSYQLEPISPHLMTPKPVFDASASFMASSTTLQSPFVAMERQERQLQRDLQALLDAQSEGLLAGLSGTATGEASSNGTRTPSTSAPGERAGRIVPVRQPVKKKLGLHGARRRILGTIQELAILKSEESRILETEVGVRDEVLQQVEGFGKKKVGLEQEMAGIEGLDESRQLSELQAEAKRVEIDIQELETTLCQMRAMHRRLTAQISGLDNSVQAKLSSYTASLSIVDAQVRKFLDRPPVRDTGFSPAKSSFLSLPPKRRTLEMAREHWLSERELLEKKRGEVEIEKGALDDGAVVWKDVVTRISEFERYIQDEVRRLGTPEKSSQRENDTHSPPDEGMRKLLEQMDPVIAHVESKFKLAESRDWKLLVCCIGAELEALKEGRLLLQGTLDSVTMDRGTEGPVDDGLEDVGVETNGKSRKRGLSEDFGLQEQPQQSPALVEGLDEEDDEPDPELLISHQDTD